MTREEKIAELINIRDNFNYTLAPREVFDDAIKALENQKSIIEKLEKIKTEILTQNPKFTIGCEMKMCLEIIDKHIKENKQ